MTDIDELIARLRELQRLTEANEPFTYVRDIFGLSADALEQMRAWQIEAAAQQQVQLSLICTLEDARDTLRAELAACQHALWQSAEKIPPAIAKAMSVFFAGWAKRLEDIRAQGGT